MPHRLIDSTIWNKKEFRKLSSIQKCLIFYLLTACDHAGICEADLETLTFIIGDDIQDPVVSLPEEFRPLFLERHNKWFMPLFLKNNYRDGLNSQKPVVVSARKILEEYNLSVMVNKMFGEEFLMIKKSLNNHSTMIKEKEESIAITNEIDKGEKEARDLEIKNLIRKSIDDAF